MRLSQMIPRPSLLVSPPAALACGLALVLAFGVTSACTTTGDEPEPTPAEPTTANPEPEPSPTPNDGGTPEQPEPAPEPSPTPTPNPPDSGTPEPSDAGNPEPSDAGSPEPDVPGPCAVADPCGGAAATEAVTFNTGANTSFAIGGDTFVIGTATRAEIETALGVMTADSTNPFRSYACSSRLDLRFVDDVDNDGLFEGNASADDILSRVLTMSGTDVTATGGITLDSTRTAATGSLSTPTAHTNQGFDFDFDFDEGISIRSQGGDVEGIALFKPQVADRVGMTFSAITLSLTDGNDSVTLDNDMGETANVLGGAFDADAIVQEAQFNSFATARVYGAYGIRIGDICAFGNCGNVDTFILSSPFLGTDSNGLGLGSTQAEIETFYGPVDRFSGDEQNDDDNVHVYLPDVNDTDIEVGVLFVQDEDCNKRAAAFVLPLVEAP